MRFKIRKSAANGQYWFAIVATNGKILASSELYRTKAAAVAAAELVRQQASSAAIEDLV